MATGSTSTFDQIFTVTSIGPGVTNFVFSGRINLIHPFDTTDRVPTNNTTRLSYSVTCLAPIHAEHMLDIRNRSLITTTQLYGGNDFRLGTDATVDGDVLINGKVSLWSRARIEGDLILADSLMQQDGVVITGSVIQGINTANVKIPDKTVVAGSRDVTINNDQSGSWAPGSYQNAMVRARGILALTAGEYNFQSLRVEPDAEIVFDTSEGTIEVNVVRELELGDRVQTSGASPTTVKLYSNSTNAVRFGTNVEYGGALIAPFAHVHVFSQTTAASHIWADRITIEPDVITN